MSRSRLKRTVSAVAFGIVFCGLVLVFAFALLSDDGGGVATAAPPDRNLNVAYGNPSIGPLGSGGALHSLPAFSARQLPASKRAHATISHELLRYSLQPRLVQSFRFFSAGYITTPVFIPAAEVAALQDDSSSVPVAPIVLFGSAAGWMYLALSGGFDSDNYVPGTGNPPGTPPTVIPPTAGTPTQTDPSNPGNNPPGNDPGNPPGGNPGNPPGNNPGNPPGNNPGNPPGNNPETRRATTRETRLATIRARRPRTTQTIRAIRRATVRIIRRATTPEIRLATIIHPAMATPPMSSSPYRGYCRATICLRRQRRSRFPPCCWVPAWPLSPPSESVAVATSSRRSSRVVSRRAIGYCSLPPGVSVRGLRNTLGT